MKIFKIIVVLITLTLFDLVHVKAQEATLLVYELTLHDEISKGTVRQFGKAMDEAEQLKAGVFLLNLNTYGGMLDAADSIRTRLLNAKMPTIVFINNNAASAGALISIACEKIYMRKGANIGAATVVDMQGEVVPDKYQSYMRSMMRSTAEARQRDPKIAEAMVDPRIYIPGVNDSGKVLTFTSSEAIANKYCDGVCETEEEVLKAAGVSTYKIISHQPTWIDKVIGFLINPAVSGVLILVMLGGVYYEVQSPGIGFPLFAAILAAVLYFAPMYLEGLASNWEILITVIGFLLILTELLIIPGFGVAGISGITLLIIGLTTSMLNNDGLDFTPVGWPAVFSSLAIVMVSMVGALLLFLFTGKFLTDTPLFKKMVLQTDLSSSSGYAVGEATQTALVGKSGITLNTLRPSGKIEVEGEIYFASAESGFIDANEKIIVVNQQLNHLVVRKQHA